MKDMPRHTIIIAEAGVNHNGSMDLAKRLVEEAAKAGVDYVKFQTFKAGNLVTKAAHKAEYQKANTGTAKESQFEMLKKLELSIEDHLELVDYCKQVGVGFFSTAFDLESIEFLHSLNLGLWKVPSGEITNYPYLRKIAGYGEPVILSTGMSELQDIDDAIIALERNGLNRELITVLHCNTEYPTPFEDVNLLAMLEIKQKFSVSVGYSDHTRGIEVPVAAAALGAVVLEKHFTLDKTLPGPDHKASLEPQELKNMVDAVRNVEKSLGDGHKRITASERKNIAVARKSIVAARQIKKGDMFTEENLTVKRPGKGISPMRWNEVLGTKAIKDFDEEELIVL